MSTPSHQSSHEIVIKQSPFVFLKHVAILELLLTAAPMLAAAIFDFQRSYELSGGERVLSYNLLLALAQIVIQVAIIGVTFALWQFPTYRIGEHTLSVEPGPWVENPRIAPLDAVLQVDVRQGWLARRLGYGTLLIQVAHQPQPLVMTNIPDPWHYAEEILDRTAVQPAPAALLEDKSLAQLLAQGEGQFLEYKSSLMWDYRKQAVNKDLYEPVMKNLVGFMNTAGGWLLIGVDDDGQVLGIEPDFTGLKKKDVDGFENVFNVAFGNMIGIENRQYIDLAFPQQEGKIVCRIGVQPAPHPVYLTFGGKEEFYIRAGNGCQALSVRKATQYIAGRFQKQLA
jgi:membrane protein YdbS with pleckstrin-like domain